MAASEKTNIGIITADKVKLDMVSGIPTKAIRRMSAMPIRSWRIGNSAMSAA